MQDLITSFIIQSKECKLPGIGKFRVITTPAEPDIVNKQIAPPVTEFLFTGKEEKISDELVKYVASKKNINFADALGEIKKWCTETRSRLENDGEILLESLGILKKGGSGNIFFHRLDHLPFFGPVIAERVIHKNSDHAMLVGDRETTSTAMNQFLNEQEERKSNPWKITALILVGVALLILLFYLYEHSFSFSAMGNQDKISPRQSPSTYTIP